MMRYQLTALALLLVPLVAPSQAGIIFGRKKDKVDPRQRVPELIVALKADKDGDKRLRAAEELREYDPAMFPEVIPALIEALNSDAKAGVRIEAAHSLSKLRPVSPVVGEALEQAVSKDESMRVRLQARSALLQYHWAGYRGKKAEVPPLNTTREPPLGEKGPPVIDTSRPAPTPVPPPDQKPAPQPVIKPVPATPVPVPAPSKRSRIRVTPVSPSDAPVIRITPAPKTPGPTMEPPLAAPLPKNGTGGSDGPEL